MSLSYVFCLTKGKKWFLSICEMPKNMTNSFNGQKMKHIFEVTVEFEI